LKEHAYLELLWEGEYYDDILFLVCNMSAFWRNLYMEFMRISHMCVCMCMCVGVHIYTV
jgi:hypothetical protein